MQSILVVTIVVVHINHFKREMYLLTDRIIGYNFTFKRKCCFKEASPNYNINIKTILSKSLNSHGLYLLTPRDYQL